MFHVGEISLDQSAQGHDLKLSLLITSLQLGEEGKGTGPLWFFNTTFPLTYYIRPFTNHSPE